MRVVIDTNVLLVSASRKAASFWIFDAFLKKKFELSVTTEIVAEYEEQFGLHWDAEAAEAITAVLVNATNTIFTTVYYQSHLLRNDIDDNKFSDCAFAANADYLVTNDKGFNLLKTIDFPKIRVVSLQEFKQILLDRNLLEL